MRVSPKIIAAITHDAQALTHHLGRAGVSTGKALTRPHQQVGLHTHNAERAIGAAGRSGSDLIDGTQAAASEVVAAVLRSTASVVGDLSARLRP